MRGLLSASLVLLFLTLGCGGKYSDVIAVNEKFAKHLDACTKELEQAHDAKQAARALNDLADALEGLSPKMKRLADKYPELKGGQTVGNPALEESQKNVEAVSQRFFMAMMKTAQFRDEKVRKAQERVSRAMMITGS